MGTKKCPFCAEEIQAEAIKCRFCNAHLDGKLLKQAKQQRPKEYVPGWLVFLTIVGTIIGCVFFGVHDWSNSQSKNSKPNNSLSSITAPQKPSKIEVWSIAEMFIERYIKLPRTASYGGFSDYQDPELCVTDLGDDSYVVKGWVEAQNSFGGTVRNYFTLKIKHEENGDWELLEKPVITPR